MTSPMYPTYDPAAQQAYGYANPNPVDFPNYGGYAAYPFTTQHMYPQWNAAGVGAVGVGVQGLGYHTQHPPQSRPPRNNNGGRGGKPRLQGGRDGRGGGQAGRHNVGSPQQRTMQSNPKTEITPSAGAASMTSELDGWSHAGPTKRGVVISSINLIQEETTIRINMNENTGVIALTGSPAECGKVMERILTIWGQLHDSTGVRPVQNTRPQQQQHQHQQQQQDRRPQRQHYQQTHNGSNRAIGGHTNGFASQQQLARDTRDLGHHSAHTHGPQDPTLHHALHQQHIQQAQSPFGGIPGLLPTMPMDPHHTSYLQQHRAREQQQQQQQQTLIPAMPQHPFANSLGHNLGGVSTWGQQQPLKQTFSAPGPQPQPVPQQLPQPVAQPVQQPQPIPQSQSPIGYGSQSHVVSHPHPTVFDAPQTQPQPQPQTQVQQTQAHHTAHPASPVDMGLGGLGYRLTQSHPTVQTTSPVSAPPPAAVSPLATPTPVQQVTPVQELVQPTFPSHLAEDEENVPETNFEEQFESPPPSPQLPPPVVQPVAQPAAVVQPIVQPPPRSPSPVMVAAVVSQPSSPVASPVAVDVAPPALEEEDSTLQYGGVDSTDQVGFVHIEVPDDEGGFLPEEKFGGDEVVVTVVAVLPSEELREWQKFAKNGGVGVRMPQVLNQYQSTVWQFGNDE